MKTRTFDVLAPIEVLAKVTKGLAGRGFLPEVAPTSADALARITRLIPAGASVMNGSSRTLEEIGFVEYLKNGTHGWNNLHAAVLAEKDPERQKELRKLSVISDYYLGSAHAITEAGEIVIASNTGSQLPHVVYTSPNIILVVGTQKIVRDLPDAFERIDTYILPLEDVNILKKYGSHTAHSKTVILHQEKQNRRVHVIFVNEKLGF
ncbi:MAG: hypothetical protein UY97_C0005G0018 [Parcubacteria group bacterium GW2011_GWB1_57_6]|nr:MAG: hypothetical protein UY97_C0005G0018 [Parcubacteria group bacterium GW2011_GWB1_57_6]